MKPFEKIKTFLFKLELIVFDLIAFNAAFLLSWWLRPYMPLLPKPFVPLANYAEIILLANFVILLIFWLAGLYRDKTIFFDTEEAYKIFGAVFFAGLIVMATTYLSRTYSYSRFVIVAAFFSGIFLIFLARFLFNRQLAFLRKRGFEKKNTLIIGAGVMGALMAKKINKNPGLGYWLIGFLDDDPQKIGQKIEGVPVLGGVSQVDSIIKNQAIQEVFVALPAEAQQKVIELVMKYEKIEFKIVPNLLEIITEPISFSEFKDIPLITVKGSSIPIGYDQLKRIFDFGLALIILIGLAPFWLLLILLIKLTSPGPVFFMQTRVGFNKKHFTFYKFRSMVTNAEQLKDSLKHLNVADGPYFKIPNDPRVTAIGRFLRRTCLDELPQLINVLKGEMSLAGPRPPLPEEIAASAQSWPEKRFSVRPGLTGLWQVSGRHEVNFDKTSRLDLYYIKHRSFLLDLEIILKTIPAVLFLEEKW